MFCEPTHKEGARLKAAFSRKLSVEQQTARDRQKSRSPLPPLEIKLIYSLALYVPEAAGISFLSWCQRTRSSLHPTQFIFVFILKLVLFQNIFFVLYVPDLQSALSLQIYHFPFIPLAPEFFLLISAHPVYKM